MIVKAVLSITFVITCVAIAIIDIQKQKIYNETVAVLLVPAIVSFFSYPEISPASRFLGALSVSGVMLFMCLMIPGAFGGGDIKLMVPVGMFLGLERTLAAGLFAVLVGGLWSVAVLVKRYGKRRRTGNGSMEFPFGPALCIGSIVALFMSDKVLSIIV